MAECPYCSVAVDDDDRYCPRCGERQTDLKARAGFLDPEVVQYLDGVRNGARPFDPESPYHEQFETDVAAAVADFAHLAGIDLDLHEVLDLDGEPAETAAADPVEADATDQQLLGLAVLLALVSEAFPETGVDELLASAYERRER